jgi:alpha-tubulin suppressor-like RCC1 family protein
MIQGMFRGKVTQISCGETHSACVTDHFCLYTWGSGLYGRLGHGFDTNEKKPKLL